MASGAQTFSRTLKLLRETSNAKEKREALTYIRSNSKKMESANAIKEDQYKELCKLVIDTFSNGDDSTQLEAYETLSTIIKDFKDHALNLFDAMLLANGKSRLKLIKLLEVLDDNVILTLTWDTVAVDFFKDCLYNVQVKTMDWLSPTSCVENLQPLIQAENKPLTADQKLQEETITHVMTFLRRLYKLAVMTSDLSIDKFDILLLDKVILLAYMGHKRQRDPALKLLQQAISTEFGTNIRKNYADVWARFKTTLQSTYCKRMLLLVGSCEVDWATQWHVSIQLLGTDLHRGAGLINNLLSVEEKAFKSTEAIIRRQAFLSWKLLVDNFALDPQELATARRIKLLCIPLNAKNSKTELIALTKLEVWWHVIIKLYKDITPFSNPVITQFLNFCFGPLGDTPLLSSKFNILASPGKRFYKTKIVALDALCQLLVTKSENQKAFSTILDEILPHAITDAVFQECYKTVIHSVGEALLILSQLTDSEMKTRYQLAKVFWKSLVNYVQETESKEKDLVCKNVILVTTELINYARDKPMIKELFLDTILTDLCTFTEATTFEDETIPLMTMQIFQTSLMLGAGKREYDTLERIIHCSIKPRADAAYRPNSLKRLRNLLGNVSATTTDQYWHAVQSELWKVLTNVLIKYMDDSGPINEGNAAKHDFSTIELVLIFPCHHSAALNNTQVQEVAKLWKKLYSQFELYADMLTTVTPNEIVLKTALALQTSLTVDKGCTSLIVNCLDTLLNSINYKALSGMDGIPIILRLLLTIATNSFSSRAHQDCDTILKAMSAFLITVYGHDAETVVSYLYVCEPVVAMALKSESTLLSKEVSNIWETVVSIFKGLGKLLDHELLLCYKKIILQALHHTNPEIELQALGILELQGTLSAKANGLLESLARIVKKDKAMNLIELSNRKKELNGKVAKSVKPVGSFLGRGTASSAVSPASHEKEADKRKSVFLEPDSQDYVFIKTEVKFDINRMTEHQKENLKRRRDDIPALYNDLSQSSSQDSQNLQEWFDRKNKHIAETDKSSSKVAEICDHDANKENKIVASISDTTDKQSNTDVQSKSSGNVAESAASGTTPNTNVGTDSEKEQTKEYNNSIVETSEKTEQNSVAKNLNFDNQEEFPDEGSSEARHSPSLLDTGKRRLRRTMSLKTDSVDLDAQKEATSNSRVLRGKVRSMELKKDETLSENSTNQTIGTDGTNRGVKRKAASDSEFEGHNSRRKRKLNDAPADSFSTHSLPSKSPENISSLTTTDVSVSQRTKHELSRLQINMVFDCSAPVRRRSRLNEEPPTKEVSAKKIQSPEKEKRKPREVEKDDKCRRSDSPTPRLGRRPKRGRPTSRSESETQATLSEKNNAKVEETQSQETPDIIEETPSEMDEDVATSASTLEKSTIIDTGVTEWLKHSKDTAPKTDSTPEPFSQDIESQDDGEEIVESSQVPHSEDKDKQREIPLKVANAENCIKVGNSSSIRTIILDEKKGEFVEQIISTVDSQVESSQEEERRTTNDVPKASDTLQSMKGPLLGFNSSKNNIKRLTKFKPQGRTAHMLGMVTKQSRLESDGNVINVETELQTVKVKAKDLRLKDLETDTSTKKDRPSTPTTPCSSRQEKIFNNMKSSDFSTPIKLFSNLRNDGEKVSPKLEKSLNSPERVGEEKRTDENLSPSPEREHLPMLEWSSANPPSLTASPSASILKRNRQSAPEPDTELGTPSKRKRVSFADPPVSKEMGYQIAEPSSPHKVNKSGSARSFTNRRDSPYRLKHRPKFIEIESDNSLVKEAETSVEIDETDVQAEQDTELIAEVLMDTDSIESQSEEMNIEVQPSTEGNDPLTSDPPMTHNKVTIDTLTLEFEITEATGASGNVAANLTEAKESQQMSKDIAKSPIKANTTDKNTSGLSSVLEAENLDKEKSLDSDIKAAISNNSTLDSLPFNDSILDNLPEKRSVELEDTVDANNLTGIDSSANSDDIFCGKPVRTSTQAVEIMPEQDTLPVTDSLFGSLPMSQESQTGSQLEIPRPELLDGINPIYPDLASCTEPLKSIVRQLTYPLWVNHLSAYFSNRGLQTVGDLAQLTEREISRIPVKGKSKVDFVKSILKHLETSEGKQDSSLTKDKSEDPALADTKIIDESMPCTMSQDIITQDMEITPKTKSKESLSHSTPLGLASGSKSRINSHVEHSNNDKSLEELVHDSMPPTLPLPSQTDLLMTDPSTSRCYGNTCDCAKNKVETKSTGTCTDPVKLPPRKATKSVEAQMELSDLLDEIDLQLVLESAARRCTPEKLLAEYKNKMSHVPDSELEVETIRLLGLEIRQNYRDATLKAGCRACGLTKVLSRLPDIFSSDQQFFTKVLNTYQKKLKTSDCINVLNFAEVKDVVCQKSTPSELAEMLSQKLQEEEQAGIMNPLNELPSLNAILKRMPMDVIISHTVANDELIPSRLVLDIALENNGSETVAKVINRKPGAFCKKVFDKLWSPTLAIEHITTSGQSKENLLNIFEAVSAQLSAEDLLNAYHEAMKKKL